MKLRLLFRPRGWTRIGEPTFSGLMVIDRIWIPVGISATEQGTRLRLDAAAL